ncbi:MAG: GSCFA domain-containing protein [Rikenellaceae bacterium]
MIFRTPIHLTAHNYQITHKNSIFCIGSCFAENISKKFSEYRFDAISNPFGVLYNPVSICNSIERIINNTPFTDKDILLDKTSSLYFSYDAYTLFNSEDKDEILQNLNKKLAQAHEHFTQSDTLIITLGTSFVYKLKDSDYVVANCQKQHPATFTREKLSVNQISETLSSLFEKESLKNKQIIVTVSPIRHKKDGFEANSLSKASLLCSVHEMCDKFDNVSYFPSYEIMMDDLRDYRFYAEDMIHPSEQAISYIWEQFKTRYIPEGTQNLFSEIKLIQKRLNHKPFNPDSESHKKFLSDLDSRIDTLNKKMGKNIF